MKHFILLIFLALATSTYAQSPTSDEINEDFEEDFVDPDSVDYESYTKKTSSFKALFNGKPGNAILYGLLIPGGGQMYNKDYWKIPIAWAAEGAGVYAFIYLRGEYNKFNDAYRNTVLGEEGIEYRGVSGVNSLNNFREQFQKQSEQAGVAIILVHIVVAVEAYIDRHLSSFDIDEDLTLDYHAPGIEYSGALAGISLKYKF